MLIKLSIGQFMQILTLLWVNANVSCKTHGKQNQDWENCSVVKSALLWRMKLGSQHPWSKPGDPTNPSSPSNLL